MALMFFSVVLALTSLSCRDVGLGLSTMGVNGVSSSSSASLMALELTAGVNIEENNVTSASRDLLSLGCKNSFLLE